MPKSHTTVTQKCHRIFLLVTLYSHPHLAVLVCAVSLFGRRPSLCPPGAPGVGGFFLPGLLGAAGLRGLARGGERGCGRLQARGRTAYAASWVWGARGAAPAGVRGDRIAAEGLLSGLGGALRAASSVSRRAGGLATS